jgi:hypothetical protein
MLKDDVADDVDSYLCEQLLEELKNFDLDDESGDLEETKHSSDSLQIENDDCQRWHRNKFITSLFHFSNKLEYLCVNFKHIA